MDRRNNPYAPGAGINPPELAGRDQLLEDAGMAMDRILGHRSARGMLLLGLRGVGKTVLLNHLKGSAEDKRLHAVKLEAPEEGELAKRLGPALKAVLYQLQPVASAGDKARRALSVLRNFLATFKVSYGEIGITLEPAPGKAESGNLEQDLPDLLLAVAEAAADRHSGLVLLIDEVQYLSGEELAALIVACHEAAQRGLPLLLVGAGLPQIAALAGNAKSLRRAAFHLPNHRTA
ncbi:MAG TPA: ATP-binding protein [Terriglobales bacterium]|nr:ATP-binding protein [Terriglobales bacterium]